MKRFLVLLVTLVFSGFCYSDSRKCLKAIETNDNALILEQCNEGNIVKSFTKFRYAQALLWKHLSKNHIEAYMLFGIHKADEEHIAIIKRVSDLMFDEAEKAKGQAPIIYGSISSILLLDHPNPIIVHDKAEAHRNRWLKKSADSGFPLGMYLYGLKGLDASRSEVIDSDIAQYLYKAAENNFEPGVRIVQNLKQSTDNAGQ